MRLKHSANPASIKPEMVLASFIVDGVYRDYGYECVGTSLNDSDHHEISRHFQGMAEDFRTRHLPEGLDVEISEEITKRLGKHYYVALKVDHIHVAYKPRKP